MIPGGSTPVENEIGSVSKQIEILKGTGKKKRDAQERIAAELAGKLHGTAVGKLKGRPGADPEIAAESAIRRVLSDIEDGKLDGVQNREQLAAVAHKNLRNRIIDEQRRAGAVKRGENPVHFTIDDPDHPVHLEGEGSPAETRLMIRDFLKLCSREEQLVIVLQLYAGFTVAEMAEIMGVSERQVGRLAAGWKAKAASQPTKRQV